MRTVIFFVTYSSLAKSNNSLFQRMNSWAEILGLTASHRQRLSAWLLKSLLDRYPNLRLPSTMPCSCVQTRIAHEFIRGTTNPKIGILQPLEQFKFMSYSLPLRVTSYCPRIHS